MAVVKADGFGHGAAAVARTALRNGATWLGVTSIREALALRRGDRGAGAELAQPGRRGVRGGDPGGVDLAVPGLEHLRAVEASRAGARGSTCTSTWGWHATVRSRRMGRPVPRGAPGRAARPSTSSA